MLESQKNRIYEHSRLRAHGMSEEQIRQTQAYVFRPAFENGKRRTREEGDPGQGRFEFRRPG